jgi:hypothetical protein
MSVYRGSSGPSQNVLKNGSSAAILARVCGSVTMSAVPASRTYPWRPSRSIGTQSSTLGFLRTCWVFPLEVPDVSQTHPSR